MRPIDEKIVKMKMDNSDFANKAEKTVGIFAKLSQAFGKVKNLDLKKSTDGLSRMQTQADRTNLNSLARGVENVSSKFNAMGAIAFSVLNRLTTKAVDAGLRMARALTIAPIKDGLDEYETKINAVQTIMSNTMGKSSMADITATLGDLNTYADKTIYNFAEMTRNIGTFTAAGVGLEDSQNAIKGIANLAAASGSNSQQASTAMYQLSQALATGSVKLQDWNSVVNAGMGGKLFQEALDKTAKKLGKGRDQSVSFRESLQDGWITTEVLMETLKEFSVDESMLDAATKVKTFTQLIETTNEAIGSGWANTWEIILGDFESAKEMWSAAADAIAGPIEKSANARNTLLKDFVELGGRNVLIQAVSNTFKGLLYLFGLAKGAWAKVFPPLTAYTILEIARGIRDLTERIKPNLETAKKLSKIFEGVFAIFRIGIEVAKLVGEAFLALIPEGAGTGILDFAVRVAELIIEFKDALVEGRKVEGQFDGIKNTVAKVVEGLKNFKQFIENVFSGTVNVLDAIWKVIQPVVEVIAAAIGDVTSQFTYQDIVNGGFVAAILLVIKKLSTIGDGIKGIFESITDAISGISGSFSVFEELGEALRVMTGSVKADTLMKIAVAVGVMAVSIKLLSGIDAQDISKSVFAIATVMVMLNTALTALGKIDLGRSSFVATVLLPALALSVLGMAGALRIIAGLDTDEMARGLTGLVVIVVALAGAMTMMSKFSGGMKTSAVGMVGLATAVVILASAVRILGKMDTENLAKGVIAVGIILLELSLFMKVVDGSKISMGSATALVIITGAVHIMIQAIKSIADIPVNDLVQGLVTIGAILLEIGLFTKLTSGAQSMSAAISMTVIAGALLLLVKPIEQLGGMDLNTLATGFGAMAVALGLMVAAMHLASGAILGAVSITAMAVALNLIAVPLKLLGSMSVGEIASALILLAGAMTVMGVAAYLIGFGGAAVLMAVAAAIGAIGLASIGIAAALTAFVAALAALAALTIGTVKNMLEVFGVVLDGFILLVPKFVELIVTWVTSMAQGFAEMAPTLANAAATMILGLLNELVTFVPEFVKLSADFIIGLMDGLAEKTPDLIDSGVNLIIQLIDGLAQAIIDNEEKMVSAVMNTIGAIMLLVVEALVQLVDVIFGWIPGVGKVAREMGDEAKDGLYESFDLEPVANDRIDEFGRGINGRKRDGGVWGGDFSENVKDKMGGVDFEPTGDKKANEYIGGVNKNKSKGRGAGRDLGNETKKGAAGVSVMDTGKKAADGFTKGIGSKNYLAKVTGTELATSAKTGASGVSLKGIGGFFADGFASGIAGRVWNVVRSATGMVSQARGAVQTAAAIRSPSRVMMEDGGHFGDGFAIGIDKSGKHVLNSADNMANTAIEAVRSYASVFADELLKEMTLNPTITPIMDLSKMDTLTIPENVDIRGVGNRQNLNEVSTMGNRQSTGNHVEYNIHLTANGDIPQPTIKRMARQLQTEIKKQNDKTRMSRGEAVIF